MPTSTGPEKSLAQHLSETEREKLTVAIGLLWSVRPMLKALIISDSGPNDDYRTKVLSELEDFLENISS